VIFTNPLDVFIMKKIKLIAVVIPLLFACTPDGQATIEQERFYQKSALTPPANPANPYDAAGALRNRILSKAFTDFPQGAGTTELLESMRLTADSDSDFETLKTASYKALSNDTLGRYLGSPPQVAQAVALLPMSQKGKADFTSFLNGLLALQAQDYETLQAYIRNFEDTLLSSGSYSAGEKKLMLTVSSLERYSEYYRRKPKDKDWDLLLGNLIAGVEGVAYDQATAVFNSAAVEAALHINP
jgi:hypothetical protein